VPINRICADGRDEWGTDIFDEGYRVPRIRFGYFHTGNDSKFGSSLISSRLPLDHRKEWGDDLYKVRPQEKTDNIESIHPILYCFHVWLNISPALEQLFPFQISNTP
jgi:hypothetical protein